jgi:hypothetical protein
MITATLAAIVTHPTPPPVPSDPVTIGPGAWLNLIGTVLTVGGSIFAAVRYVVRRFTALTRTSTGQPLAKLVEDNSGVLAVLAERVETVADDVRDVRTHQSGLTNRVDRIEQYIFPTPGSTKKGWFK